MATAAQSLSPYKGMKNMDKMKGGTPAANDTNLYYAKCREAADIAAFKANRRRFIVGAVREVVIIAILTLVLFGYTVLGAYIFTSLEQHNEQTVCQHNEDLYGNASLLAVSDIQDIGLKHINTEFEGEAVALIQARLRAFRDNVILVLNYNGKNCSALGQPGGPQYNWSFIQAILFCISTFSTIGYGNVVPATSWGRVVCIVYALLGLPIMFSFLAVVGELMAKVFRFTYSFLCCLGACQRNRASSGQDASQLNVAFMPQGPAVVDDMEEEELEEEEEEGDDHDSISVPMTFTLLLVACYVMAGGFLYVDMEDWNYLQAAYFCFITISTIGFGDVMPDLSVPADSGWKLTVLSLYLSAGLALMAMGIDLIQFEMAQRFTAIGGQNIAQTGHVRTLDVLEGRKNVEDHGFVHRRVDDE